MPLFPVVTERQGRVCRLQMIEHLLAAGRVGIWIRKVKGSRRAGSAQNDCRNIGDAITSILRTHRHQPPISDT